MSENLKPLDWKWLISMTMFFVVFFLIWAAVPLFEPYGQCSEGIDSDRLFCVQNAEAKRTADWARFSAFVGVLGTIGLAGTLFFSASATKAAQDAAKASAEVLKAERAWITFATVEIGTFTNGFVDAVHVRNGLIFICRMHNFGRTLAVNVRAYRDFRFLPVDSPPPYLTVGQLEDGFPPVGADVPSSSPFMLNPVVLTDMETRQFTSRTHVLYVQYWIKYFDIFDSAKERETSGMILIKSRGGSERYPNGDIGPSIDRMPVWSKST